ncbi:MAG TPA: TIGR03067 domain-containing protein [Steroidobacteraceae bacterium]|nr:TIGR03067 domain-containing protein [Steroidobacteraceae bacterium]
MQQGLEGAWVPIAANVGGKELIVHELRVKYLVLDGAGYSIVDRTNHIVDSGDYLVDEAASPQTMDIVGREGPNAGRTMLAIYELDADRLTVCYDLDGKERPSGMQPLGDQLLLSITYERARRLLS